MWKLGALAVATSRTTVEPELELGISVARTGNGAKTRNIAKTLYSRS